jgi:hypothetical protein
MGEIPVKMEMAKRKNIFFIKIILIGKYMM